MTVGIFKKTNKYFNKFELALENIADGIYITDKNTKTIYVNKAYERISNTQREKFLGKTIYKVVEEGLINVSGTIKSIEKKESISINQILNNGKTAFITSTPIFNSKFEIEYIVTIVRDITEITYLKTKITEKENEINLLKELKMNKVIHKSKEMNFLLQKIIKIANYDTTVFLTGETGVGKNLIAKQIHDYSCRKEEKFVQLNCGAIPSNLIESELFGYEKGAFTGALKQGKIGIFEQANKGTLFLDEICELPLDMQPKLLTAIQDKKIRPIGSENEINIDVRIIAATNKDMKRMVEENRFREDLYYRLNVIPIEILPLRSRCDDIVPLSVMFLNKLEKKHMKKVKVDREVFNIFYNYEWPGNVRELENLMERLYIMCDKSRITVEDLPANMMKGSIEDINYIMPLKEANYIVESRLIKKAFQKTGNVRDAAKLLEISDATFVRKRQKYKEMNLIE